MADIDTNMLPDGVTLGTGGGDLPVLDVETPSCTARVYPYGAFVAAWQPAGTDPVLWLSDHARYTPGLPIRGGIPVVAPWFGPGRKKDKPHAHGWFRTSTWTLADASRDGDDVTLRFTLDGADGAVPDGEPNDIRGEYVVRIGAQLHLELTVTAGADPLELEEALHAYFAVSDVHDVRVEGLDGCRYADKAPGGRAVNRQSGDLEFKRETDRVYAHEGTATLVDPGKGRRIVVTKTGSANTVTWNPWSTKAVGIGDFGDDEWTSMACVETANALNDRVQLDAGASHTMTATYTVESL